MYEDSDDDSVVKTTTRRIELDPDSDDDEEPFTAPQVPTPGQDALPAPVTVIEPVAAPARVLTLTVGDLAQRERPMGIVSSLGGVPDQRCKAFKPTNQKDGDMDDMMDDALECDPADFSGIVQNGVPDRTDKDSAPLQSPTKLPAPSCSSSSLSSSSARAALRTACTTTDWKLRLDVKSALTNYEKSAIIFNPTVEQLFEGYASCLQLFGAFFMADPNLTGLPVLDERVTLIIGAEVPDTWTKGVNYLCVPKNKWGEKLFHVKLLLLEFPDRLRVWITSANLLGDHFGPSACRETAWVQDFPLLPSKSNDPHAPPATFQQELRSALMSIEEIPLRLERPHNVTEDDPALKAMRDLG